MSELIAFCVACWLLLGCLWWTEWWLFATASSGWRHW